MEPKDYNYNPSYGNPDVKISGLNYEADPELAYGEHIKDTAAICNTSASHTYGNVLSVVEKYILDLFPSNLFKTVTASTTLASRQVRHLPQQLYKKENPIMVLIPRISFGQGDDRFLGNTLINSRMSNTHDLWGEGSLLELAKDRKRRILINGHYNRALMYIDVVLSFNTYSEQVNWLSHLFNVVPVGHNQFVRAPLELYIPKTFCQLISNVSDVPIKNGESVYDFLAMMNGMFYHPITYKLKGGSNSDEFFMYYMTDIDTVIQDPQAGPGTKDGQIRRNFDITFTVRCEFNTIGYFTLNAPSIKHQVYADMPSDDMSILPLFSDVINLDDFHLPIGWSVLGWPIFKLKENESDISLEPILNQSLNVVIDYHLKYGIPMERFINIQFRENGNILNDEMFYIDWYKRVLHVISPDQHRTYRLLITVSQDYINNLIKDLYGLE